MECGKKFLYIRKTVETAQIFAFVPSRCKSWSCPSCRPIKANIVRNYVKENFTSDNLYMLTLTFYHSGSPLKTWENLGSCWNRMRTYIAKRYGTFKYLRIVEPHKEGGWPHLHVLIDGFICDKEIVKMVTNWGFGWNMHNERVSIDRAAKYVSKYLSKPWPAGDAHILRVASKCRIVSVSRGMPAVFTNRSDWSVVRYDDVAVNSLFYCNAIIDYLMHRGCQYVLCSPFGGGFIIDSDLSVPDDWLFDNPDPAVWKYCDDFNFTYIPDGLQMQVVI